MPRPKIEIAELTRVPKELLSSASVQAIKRASTFLSESGAAKFGGADRSEVTKIELWREDKDAIYVPRYFPYQRYIKGARTEVDRRSVGKEISWRFRLDLIDKPRKNQPEAVCALLATDHGILAAGPGKGKTIMALAAVSGVRRQALIIVPTEFLMNQWIERIVQATTLKHGDIGIIREDRADFDAEICVGMIHTLAKREYPKEQRDKFGIVIGDEVHRLGAPEFSKALPKFAARWRWGLSATVTRKDGLDEAFRMHIGEVVYEMMEPDCIPTVYRLHTGVSIPTLSYTNRWNGQLNLGSMHTRLAEHPRRNRILAGEIVKAFKAGRKLLGIGKRLEQLDEMKRLLCQRGVPAADVGIITRKTKASAQDVLARCRVILGIEQITGEGLDAPDLDTFCALSPLQNVEQNVGRIQRDFPGKKEPLVIECVDNMQIPQAMAGARLKIYKKYDYKVVDIDKRGAERDG